MKNFIALSVPLLLTLGVCFAPAPCAAGANILAVFPSDYRSHFTLGSVLFAALAQRGHNVQNATHCSHRTLL